MILSNANLSEDDKVILECILNDLTKNDIPTTMENIKEHSLFKKIDSKEQFDKSTAAVCSLSIGVRQEKDNRDCFTIKIGGSGLRLDNPLHAQFIEELSQKIGMKVCYFVNGSEYFLAENPSIANFLEQLKKHSCNGN